MKPSDPLIGATYVGFRGKPRRIINVTTRYIEYSTPDSDWRECERATFARWAKRLAREDERVASPEPAISRWRHTA